jgi:hypothetical protein
MGRKAGTVTTSPPQHLPWLQLAPDIEHFQVRCNVCGKVGEPQERKADAEAIADRHYELQGFG